MPKTKPVFRLRASLARPSGSAGNCVVFTAERDVGPLWSGTTTWLTRELSGTCTFIAHHPPVWTLGWGWMGSNQGEFSAGRSMLVEAGCRIQGEHTQTLVERVELLREPPHNQSTTASHVFRGLCSGTGFRGVHSSTDSVPDP